MGRASCLQDLLYKQITTYKFTKTATFVNSDLLSSLFYSFVKGVRTNIFLLAELLLLEFDLGVC